MSQPLPEAAWDAVAEWHRSFFTGLVLSVVTRRGARPAASLVERIFRRQQRERFLPGLMKLGLDGKPPAVASAEYHYLSNLIGGVGVEVMVESERKAWIRYPPPRWAWAGTAICAVPGEVSLAMLRGWHANNGAALGCERLGFVCTKQTVDGDDGLEGYFLEHDRALAPDERLRLARGEEAPDFDAARAPVLAESEWPAARRRKAHRNYATEYVRTAIPETIQLFGAAEGGHLLALTGRLIGMQLYRATASGLGVAGGTDAPSFARFMAALARAQDDEAEIVAGNIVRQPTWMLAKRVPDRHPATFLAWQGLLDGALAAHNRHLRLEVRARLDQGDNAFEWRIVEKRRT